MSPSDVNKLIVDYLSESGYDRTLFQFSHEAQVTNYKSQKNLLRKLVQKGLYHSILQQKLLPQPILLQNQIQSKQMPLKSIPSATFIAQFSQVEQFDTLKIANMYYIFVRQQDSLRVFVAIHDQLRFIFRATSELFSVSNNQLVSLFKYQVQVFGFPGCEMIDQKPVKRKGAAKFLQKIGNDYIINEYDKQQIDGFLIYNTTKYYWCDNTLKIKGNVCAITINFNDIIESNCIISIKIEQSALLVALDTGLLYAQILPKDISIISAVPQTLPMESFILVKWFLPISMLQFKNMHIYQNKVVIYTQNQVYIVSFEGKIIDYYEIENIFKAVVVNSSLCIVSTKQVMVISEISYNVKVDFSVVHGVSSAGDKLVIAHDNKIEIVTV
eukprot:EST44415.1 Hypothetical protein SS50377_15720 [Spironucleus salmonicida]